MAVNDPGWVPGRTPVEQRTHPLHRLAGVLHRVVDEVSVESAWSLTPAEAAETVAELYALLPRVEALGLASVAEADRAGVATDAACTSTAAWLKQLTRLTGPQAYRRVRLARALEDHQPTREALAAGAVTTAQAGVVTRAVDALPDRVDAADRRRAERHLLAEAASFDATALARLGRHLHDVVDPDGADARLAAVLERQDRDAARTAFLTLSHDGHGSCEGRFRVTSPQGDVLQRMLHAFTNPDRPDGIQRDTQGVRRPTPELLGEAFGQWIERFPVDRVPTLRGRNATVVVTMTLDTLLGGLAAATVDTGHRLSPRQARRLAASAGVIPAVLGGDGAVLDLGPEVRFHTPKQRLALAIQQHGTCAVEGCDRPTWWCDGAHLISHALGGHTNVTDGALICPRHHTLADHPRYHIHRLRPGRIRITRRQ